MTTMIVFVAIVYVVRQSLRNTGHSLSLLWSMFPLEQILQQQHPIFWRHQLLVNFVIGVWVIYTLFVSKPKWQVVDTNGAPASYAILGLVVFCYISIVWSISPSVSWANLTKCAPYVALFVFIGPFCLREPGSLTAFVSSNMFFGGAIVLVLAMSDYGARGLVVSQAGGEVTEGNPLALASYGAVVCISAAYVAMGRRESRKIGMLAVCVAAIGAYVVLRSMSRGQLVALFAAGGLWMPVTFARRQGVSVGSLLVVIGGAYVAAEALSYFALDARWESRFLEDAQSSRLAMISEVLEGYFAGGLVVWFVGLGNSASFRIAGFYPHNIPAEVLVEEGLLGFFLLSFSVILTVIKGYRWLVKCERHRHMRRNLGFLLTLLTFFGLLSMKQGSLLGSWYFLSSILCVNIVVDRYSAKLRRQSSLSKVNSIGGSKLAA